MKDIYSIFSFPAKVWRRVTADDLAVPPDETYDEELYRVTACKPLPLYIHSHTRVSIPPRNGGSVTVYDGLVTHTWVELGSDADASSRRNSFEPSVIASCESEQDGSMEEKYFNRRPPTEYQSVSLRKVPGRVPRIAYVLCLAECVDRAAFFGVGFVVSNFLQFPMPKGGNGAGAPARKPYPGYERPAGALNFGLQTATAIAVLYRMWSYITPVFGAWIGDCKIGRYKAIWMGVIISVIAHILQVCSTLPEVIQLGYSKIPFLISLVLVGLGTGISKSNLLPTILDQYPYHDDFIRMTANGELVIVSHQTTLTMITGHFFTMGNIGALIGFAVIYAEKIVGWWLAYLVPTIICLVLPIILLLSRNQTVRSEPGKEELNKIYKILHVAVVRSRGRFWRSDFLSRTRPSTLTAKDFMRWPVRTITWNDQTVQDVSRTLTACGMFLYFPIWFLNDGGIGTVAVSQAASLTKNDAPNDLFRLFNPLIIIVTMPLLTHALWPLLQRRNRMPRPVTRIVIGFVLAALGSLWGAILQSQIYATSPCGERASTCVSERGSVAPLSVWWQVPVFVLGALAECLSMVGGYEIAYARSPGCMKALVLSVYLLMHAVSSVLGLALTPLIRDPNLVWVWAGPAAALLLVAGAFYWRYRWSDGEETRSIKDGGSVKDQ